MFDSHLYRSRDSSIRLSSTRPLHPPHYSAAPNGRPHRTIRVSEKRQHIYHLPPRPYLTTVRSSQFIRRPLPLPCPERTCESWLHVCASHRRFFCQTGLTDVSNHDGKNLTITALVNAVQRVYNLSKPLAYLLAVTGVLLCGNGRTVDLFHLAKHGVIEHDASLSRADTQPPHKYAPTDPDPEVVDQLMHTTSHNFLVLKDFALARVSRELKAIGGPLDSIHAEIGRAESSLILQVFGGETGEVDKEVLRTWFIDGRLPDSYKIPEHVVGIFSTRSLGGRIAEAMKSIRNPGPV